MDGNQNSSGYDADRDIEPWINDLNPREQAQVVHAVDYATHHSEAGVPGHGQFMLIAKLAQMLTNAQQALADMRQDEA